MCPGLVHSPCCPWIGFGHWDRADLALAQGPVGRVENCMVMDGGRHLLKGLREAKTCLLALGIAFHPWPLSPGWLWAPLNLAPPQHHPIPSQGLPSWLDLGPVAAPEDGQAVTDSSQCPQSSMDLLPGCCGMFLVSKGKYYTTP